MEKCSSWQPDLQNRRGKQARWSSIRQAALAREHAAFGPPGPAARATLDGDGEPTVRIKVPTGRATPSADERALREASGHVPERSWCQWCIAARAADKPHSRGQQPETDEAVPRIEFYFAELGREEDQVLIPSLNAVEVGSESLSATLCLTKAFSEYLVESIVAFVEALGHNVVMHTVMLHIPSSILALPLQL